MCASWILTYLRRSRLNCCFSPNMGRGGLGISQPVYFTSTKELHSKIVIRGGFGVSWYWWGLGWLSLASTNQPTLSRCQFLKQLGGIKNLFLTSTNLNRFLCWFSKFDALLACNSCVINRKKIRCCQKKTTPNRNHVPMRRQLHFSPTYQDAIFVHRFIIIQSSEFFSQYFYVSICF